ncbi:MAG: DUF86 domain-containing protein [Firmicutes bacterium]|nr:DUF86 domain-containing protein [Bacillota bacterium]
MNEHDKNIVGKIIKYSMQAVQFKGGMDFAEFSGDVKTISACVFSLSQVGELVGRLSGEFLESNSNIEWHKIKGLRNKIVHDYEGVRLKIVWVVLTESLPELIDNLGKLS